MKKPYQALSIDESSVDIAQITDKKSDETTRSASQVEKVTELTGVNAEKSTVKPIKLTEIAPEKQKLTIQDVPAEILDSFNIAQELEKNKTNLAEYGGTLTLANNLGVNLETGLSSEQVSDMRAKYGSNVFPESPMESFLSIFIGAFGDTVLQILLAAAAVSLGVGIYEHPDNGYIEGLAIFIAVFLVAIITASNDYSKELQFRALEKESANDERASVLRNGEIERINPRDIVIGDIIILQAGDSIPADSVILDHHSILSNESGLTGESDEKKKSFQGDPFLISSCLITQGEETRAMVIGIGPRSQWGKIKANLVTESVNTPLQDKLEDMTTKVFY